MLEHSPLVTAKENKSHSFYSKYMEMTLNPLALMRPEDNIFTMPGATLYVPMCHSLSGQH